jgi:hypothetical protein
MPVYEWLQHKGKRIFYMNIAVKTPEEMKQRIAAMEPVIEKEPPKSILCLADVIDGSFSPEITQLTKDFAKHNEPYIKTTALIGVEGLKQVIFNGILLFTNRKNMVLKNSRPEALDWLAGQ